MKKYKLYNDIECLKLNCKQLVKALYLTGKYKIVYEPKLK